MVANLVVRASYLGISNFGSWRTTGVRNISDRVAVMYLGQIVEMGTRDQIFSNPCHPYTKRLIEAVPVPDPGRRRARFARLDSEIPSTVRRIGDDPRKLKLEDVGDGHLVAT